MVAPVTVASSASSGASNWSLARLHCTSGSAEGSHASVSSVARVIPSGQAKVSTLNVPEAPCDEVVKSKSPTLATAVKSRIASLSPVLRSARRRSEERRVGKGVDLGGRRIIKKKKEKQKDERNKERRIVM